MKVIRLLAVIIALTASPPLHAGDQSTENLRLQYLERSLDSSRDSVRLWQEGWTAVYGTAAITYAAMAMDSDDSDERVVNALGSLRAVLATTLLTVRPHPGRDGADPVREMAGSSLEQRLTRAEKLLQESARRTRSKRRPARHLRNLIVNLGFGGLVWAFGNRDDALPFTLLGIAGGEAVLLSLPEQPQRDLAGYRKRFAGNGTADGRWRLVPRPGGLNIQFVLSR